MLAASFSVTATLLLGELTARWFLPEETFWPVSNIYRPMDDARMGYTYKANLNTVAFGVPLETNDLGLRGRDWTRAKPESARRIVLVGDSYAFGFGVAFEKTLGEQLARILEDRTGTRHEVLNFGINGYNSRQELALLEHLALGFEPDLVIVLPTNNDKDEPLAADEEGWLHFDGQPRNRQSRMSDKWDLEDASRLVKVSRLLLYLTFRYRLLRQEFREGGLAAWLPAEGEWIGEIPAPSIAPQLSETVHRPLKQMVLLLQARDIPMIVASACVTSDYRMTLAALAEETGVPMLELMKLFPEAGSWRDWAARFGLGWDNHPNAEAHLRFARALADLIARLGKGAKRW